MFDDCRAIFLVYGLPYFVRTLKIRISANSVLTRSKDSKGTFLIDSQDNLAEVCTYSKCVTHRLGRFVHHAVM
jgi:hypothetical protein